MKSCRPWDVSCQIPPIAKLLPFAALRLRHVRCACAVSQILANTLDSSASLPSLLASLPSSPSHIYKHNSRLFSMSLYQPKLDIRYLLCPSVRQSVSPSVRQSISRVYTTPTNLSTLLFLRWWQPIFSGYCMSGIRSCLLITHGLA